MFGEKRGDRLWVGGGQNRQTRGGWWAEKNETTAVRGRTNRKRGGQMGRRWPETATDCICDGETQPPPPPSPIRPVNLISRSTLLDTLPGFEVAFCTGLKTFQFTHGDLSSADGWSMDGCRRRPVKRQRGCGLLPPALNRSALRRAEKAAQSLHQ